MFCKCVHGYCLFFKKWPCQLHPVVSLAWTQLTYPVQALPLNVQEAAIIILLPSRMTPPPSDQATNREVTRAWRDSCHSLTNHIQIKSRLQILPLSLRAKPQILAHTLWVPTWSAPDPYISPFRFRSHLLCSSHSTQMGDAWNRYFPVQGCAFTTSAWFISCQLSPWLPGSHESHCSDITYSAQSSGYQLKSQCAFEITITLHVIFSS